MDSKQQLYSALGQVAYAMAMADGEAQREEKDKFHKVIKEAVKKHDIDYDIADVIFQILDRDHMDVETTYAWAINQFKLGSNRLTDELKETMVKILVDVAKAYAPVEVEEMNLLERFEKDLDEIQDNLTY
ncbi:MAG: hypothetical protein HOB26_02020 [Flavobacteriales bacterium]|jgi:tellurite resistance protein|nr:hypothetical protein [Flavobacteriales bacterium]